MDKENIKILQPKNQLSLFGYENHFKSFVNLYNKNELPHAILLSGPRGLGKATFAYHLINYILSYKENEKYSLYNFKINSNNKSYNFLCNSTHPNFFSFDNELSQEEIKIDHVRNLLKFLSKSTFLNNLKIVLIDNSEYLNRFASNALLKVLEEPSNNTFFFIIHHTASYLQNTIKSRCIEFKFFLNLLKKKEILRNIKNQYNINSISDSLNEDFYSNSPGNLLKCLYFLNNAKFDFTKDNLSTILYLIDKYKNKKDSEILFYISFFIERFYNQLILNNSKNLENYFINRQKILNHIYDMKKFNLDKNNLLFSINEILLNETR